MAFLSYDHDPQARKHYGWNWAPYVGARTITDSEWVVSDGTIDENPLFTTTATSVWLSVDGTVTLGTKLTVTNHVTLNDGTEDDRSFILKVKQM